MQHSCPERSLDVGVNGLEQSLPLSFWGSIPLSKWELPLNFFLDNSTAIRAKVWTEGKSPKVRRKTTENFDNLATYSFLFSSKHRRETVIFLFSLLSYAWKSYLQNFRRDYVHPKIKTKTKIKKP